MRTYGDVYLTEDGHARQEDGYELRGVTKKKKAHLIRGVGVNDFPFQVGDKVSGDWKLYSMWASMLERAYDSKYHTLRPTYTGTKVDPSWYSFSGFLSWLLKQPFHSADFELDKDIIGRGKLYGPLDCMMVPQWVNTLTTDHRAGRGELPLGVTKNGGGFVARVCRGNGTRLQKTFRTVEEASNFYHDTKQQYVDSRKEELDAINERLYPNLCRILNERRMK